MQLQMHSKRLFLASTKCPPLLATSERLPANPQKTSKTQVCITQLRKPSRCFLVSLPHAAFRCIESLRLTYQTFTPTPFNSSKSLSIFQPMPVTRSKPQGVGAEIFGLRPEATAALFRLSF